MCSVPGTTDPDVSTQPSRMPPPEPHLAMIRSMRPSYSTLPAVRPSDGSTHWVPPGWLPGPSGVGPLVSLHRVDLPDQLVVIVAENIAELDQLGESALQLDLHGRIDERRVRMHPLADRDLELGSEPVDHAAQRSRNTGGGRRC